jgi:phage gp46-like protein
MIRLAYDSETAEADLVAAEDGGVAEGDDLETAVLISLFTDRYVDESQVEPGKPRGGWWGDAYADEDGDRIGSRLWLLERGIDLQLTPVRAREYALEALRWLVEDLVAREVEVEAERAAAGTIHLSITLHLADGTTARYDVEV